MGSRKIKNSRSAAQSIKGRPTLLKTNKQNPPPPPYLLWTFQNNFIAFIEYIFIFVIINRVFLAIDIIYILKV